MSIGQAYIGRIIFIDPIPNADFIESATVVCGAGGRWMGVVKKGDFAVGANCIVYLPDSILLPSESYKFLEKSSYRIRMQRFRGARSEALIMPLTPELECFPLGFDMTEYLGVRRYIKPVPAHLNGIAKGDFPGYIPKTDEPNYQTIPGLIELLQDKPYYITQKYDGSSTTAFKRYNYFGLCSRNLELERNEENGYWKVALKYDLENKLPDGIAIQWETCGPGIQSNPMGLTEIDGFVFNAYDIYRQKYLEFSDLVDLCKILNMRMCHIIGCGLFSGDITPEMAEGKYPNGQQQEGIVIRSQYNELGHKPISFKVINLLYKD